jgi:hypothetical protein
MVGISSLFGTIGFTGEEGAHDILIYGNLLFTPIILTIVFSFIGFKIYPEPKKKSSRNKRS